MRLWYEDLILPGGCRSVLDFLGLREVPLTSPFTKQGSLPLNQAILNLAEVQAFLAEKGLEHYMPPK